MKLFSVILSFYIMALTVLPCVDVHAHGSICQAEISQSMPDNHHQDFDQCSPFCTCDCCTSPVIRKDNNIYLNYSPAPQKCYIAFSSFYISASHAEIWHPPKINVLETI